MRRRCAPPAGACVHGAAGAAAWRMPRRGVGVTAGDGGGRPPAGGSSGCLVSAASARLLAALLAAQYAPSRRRRGSRPAVPPARRACSCFLPLDLASADAVSAPLLRGRRAAGRHQIGRHRGAHLRTGGVVLAQEARHLPAFRKSLRALVAGRAGGGEDLGAVLRDRPARSAHAGQPPPTAEHRADQNDPPKPTLDISARTPAMALAGASPPPTCSAFSRPGSHKSQRLPRFCGIAVRSNFVLMVVLGS